MILVLSIFKKLDLGAGVLELLLLSLTDLFTTLFPEAPYCFYYQPTIRCSASHSHLYHSVYWDNLAFG
ncbi:hypothetical protein OZY43_03100 [Lactobacillus sp. ESL0785]|uniref:hypothetical protein n=1 Tax=Lactobacillus sp. ESL0785 TaxID=2983232 RepID=UPI0023F880ED|nr:hypothetical protein [Lactobacillus sp. ESL0785]WEV71404.1 hypothetical protein OZY43_03100 [Lactobacillus sp. ESL0785]